MSGLRCATCGTACYRGSETGRLRHRGPAPAVGTHADEERTRRRVCPLAGTRQARKLEQGGDDGSEGD